MTLLDDLQQSPPSRELSDRVLLACGWDEESDSGWWRKPDGKVFSVCEPRSRPDPTRNLQDAVDWVVPEGWTLQLFQRETGWFCRLKRRAPYELVAPFENAKETKVVPTGALALCIAALRAREERNE